MLRLVISWALVVGALAHDLFHVSHPDGRYKIRDREHASKFCDQHNGRLATMDEVKAAHSEGFDRCDCGWVTNDVALPINKPRAGCGSSVRVAVCPEQPKSWGVSGWDAFCVEERKITCEAKVGFGPHVHEYANKPDDHANLFLDFKFEYDGVLSAWEYYSLRDDMAVYAAVYRPLSENRFMTVGRTKLDTRQSGQITYVLKEEEKFKVKKGDIVGIHYDTVLFMKSRDYTVIPYATGENNCDQDGHCVAEADQYDTWVFHRHEQQLFFRPEYVLKLDKIYEEDKKKERRAPALRPIYCAEGVVFTTTTESTTTETTTTTERTTPEPTPEPTTLPPPTPSTTTTTTEATTTPEPTTESTTTTTTAAPTTEPPTTVNFDVTEDGSNSAEAQPDEVPCSYPFTYRGTDFYGCTEVMSAGQPWCSTERVYTGKQWRYCNEGDKTVEDFPCVFPFTYNGQSYSECTMEQANKPWCSVNEVYSSHSWKYCDRDELKVEELPCSYPWTYEDKKRNMCIKSNGGNYWCSVTEEYHSWSWRNCRSGDRIPSEMACHYPFTYNGKQYNTCIYDGDSKPWCPVEAEYRRDNWRYCKDGDVFPEVEPCVFPFDYNGKVITSCTYEGSERPWCSLTEVYDRQNWRYCREVDVYTNAVDPAATIDEARAACEKNSMVIASKRDAEDSFELGTETCQCGWLSDGSLVTMIHNVRQDCGDGKDKGVQSCEQKDGESYIPICTVPE